MAYALPAIPDNCYLFKVIFRKPPNDSYMISTFAFQAQSVPTSFDMLQALQVDIAPWAVHALSKTYTNTTAIVTCWSMYRYGGMTHSMTPPSGFPAWNPGSYFGQLMAT